MNVLSNGCTALDWVLDFNLTMEVSVLRNGCIALGKALLTLTISSFSEPNAEYVITVRAHNNKGDGQPKYQTAKTSEAEGKELLTTI